MKEHPEAANAIEEAIRRESGLISEAMLEDPGNNTDDEDDADGPTDILPEAGE